MSLELRDADGMARWVGVLVPASQLAERIAGTEFVPKAMRDKPDVVTAAIMYGDEIGVGPMQALAGIHVVEGRPQPSAELMRALILRDGHTLTVHEATGDRCRISGLRAGRPESERAYMEWTRDQARAAGLLGRTNWQKYPRAMLLARATSDLARMIFPDVVKGLSYIAEDSAGEVWDAVAEEPAAADPKSPRKVQRRTRPKAQPQPQPEPTDVPLPPDPTPLPPAVAAPERPPVAPETEPAAEDVPLPGTEPPARGGPPPPSQTEELPPDRFGVEPEPGPVEPEAGERSIAPPVLRALHARLGKVMERGADDHVTREGKLALVSSVVGRLVDSTGNLTRAEGYRVLDFLTACEVGEATWEVDDETGVYHIVDLREPPA